MRGNKLIPKLIKLIWDWAGSCDVHDSEDQGISKRIYEGQEPDEWTIAAASQGKEWPTAADILVSLHL